MEEAVVELWMVGLALSAVLAVAARDVGRPGNASAIGLRCLRAVGGLGLAAMAFLALRAGHPLAALVAAAGAAPLVGGLVGSRRAGRLVRPSPASRDVSARADAAPAAEERRAA